MSGNSEEITLISPSSGIFVIFWTVRGFMVFAGRSLATWHMLICGKKKLAHPVDSLDSDTWRMQRREKISLQGDVTVVIPYNLDHDIQ